LPLWGDVVSAVTRVPQKESVADEIVRRADHIELVDVSPELLRQRLSDGNVYPRDRVDAALANEFRLDNLFALREVALIWLADRVDEGLAKYRASQGITANLPVRERVVVGLTRGPEGEVLIRRASRILSRVNSGDLLAVHVRRSNGQPGESPLALEAQHRLVTDLGGSYHTVSGDDVAETLLEYARSVSATQIVLGVSQCRLSSRLLGSGVGSKVVRGTGDIDVHMVSHPLGSRELPKITSRGLGRARTTAGFVLAVLIPALVTTLMSLAPELNFAGSVQSASFLLSLLVQSGPLPNLNVQDARFEHWLRGWLGSLGEPEDRRLLRQYSAWGLNSAARSTPRATAKARYQRQRAALILRRAASIHPRSWLLAHDLSAARTRRLCHGLSESTRRACNFHPMAASEPKESSSR
jgi:K+-sensing histidine kinase KdpD